MSSNAPSAEPRRATDIARLSLAKLPPDTRLAEIFSKACELGAETLKVERVGVWLFVEDKSALRCVNLFERTSHQHSAGAILRVADFPKYFATLSIRKSVPAEIATSDPRTRELADAYLLPLQISSMLDAGIFVGGDLIGVVCHEHTGPLREWTTEDRDFAGSLADLVAARIQSADISEIHSALRTQSARIAMLEKSEALEQMTSGLAHDFRNLLAIIMGNAELVANRPELHPTARGQLDSLLSAAQRGLQMTTELLEFAQPTNRPPAVLDLVEKTTNLLSLLRSAVGAAYTLSFVHPETIGKVFIEKGQFTQVVMNLVLNARDAMPDGGDITIRVEDVELDSGAGSSDYYVVLEVKDHGVGMSEETQRRAFEPFYTTKQKGTGVGLAVVRRVADRVGGFVQIESAVGIGTSVRIFIPRVGGRSHSE